MPHLNKKLIVEVIGRLDEAELRLLELMEIEG